MWPNTQDLHLVLLFPVAPSNVSNAQDLHLVLLFPVALSNAQDIHLVFLFLAALSNAQDLHLVLLFLVALSNAQDLHLVLLFPVAQEVGWWGCDVSSQKLLMYLSICWLLSRRPSVTSRSPPDALLHFHTQSPHFL